MRISLGVHYSIYHTRHLCFWRPWMWAKRQILVQQWCMAWQSRLPGHETCALPCFFLTQSEPLSSYDGLLMGPPDFMAWWVWWNSAQDELHGCLMAPNQALRLYQGPESPQRLFFNWYLLFCFVQNPRSMCCNSFTGACHKLYTASFLITGNSYIGESAGSYVHRGRSSYVVPVSNVFVTSYSFDLINWCH